MKEKSLDLIGHMMESLSPEKREQCLKTNKAFREMIALQGQVDDLNSRLEISRLQWAREDRLWKQLLLADANAQGG